jgi:polygalacturonase
MTRLLTVIAVPVLLLAGQAPAPPPAAPSPGATGIFDVRTFGARGDGKAIDTPAINAAIAAAAEAGGGTVLLPAGTYASYSVRLKSHVTLRIGEGATLLAAEPSPERGQYDRPEPNEHDLYQDFGHSHWQNSLVWGIGLEDVAIEGPGRIDGAGLTRRGPGARWSRKAGDRPLSMGVAVGGQGDPEAAALKAMEGQGNKAVALKLCRHVRLRGFSILGGGHFALLATGVDDLTIDNLAIDTNRDGLDIDSCRNVRISNTLVNSPNDDAIVLKSSFALGTARPTENVVISNCQVSGYDVGTVLAGTYGRTTERAPDRDGPTGRIKLGTESSGGFRNVTVTNCVFDRSRGLALETVDGGDIENVTVSNITMREVTTAPIFLRVGNRGRTPGDPPPGRMRGIVISNLVATGVDPRYAALIAGIPERPVEDVRLSNIRLVYRGGGTARDAALEPPENETAYPEPSMFGTLPAYGLFVRHARNLTLRDVEVGWDETDLRPAVFLDGVAGVYVDHLTGRTASGVPVARVRNAVGLVVRDSPGFGTPGGR